MHLAVDAYDVVRRVARCRAFVRNEGSRGGIAGGREGFRLGPAVWRVAHSVGHDLLAGEACGGCIRSGAHRDRLRPATGPDIRHVLRAQLGRDHVAVGSRCAKFGCKCRRGERCWHVVRDHKAGTSVRLNIRGNKRRCADGRAVVVQSRQTKSCTARKSYKGQREKKGAFHVRRYSMPYLGIHRHPIEICGFPLIFCNSFGGLRAVNRNLQPGVVIKLTHLRETPPLIGAMIPGSWMICLHGICEAA